MWRREVNNAPTSWLDGGGPKDAPTSCTRLSSHILRAPSHRQIAHKA
ncbi:MAG: hypothetical protein QOK10_2980 [Pseudonocardiales bacterium]|jgi:hypothetical protein|nr:hypothetical protein [Pseudonocardiales bacterium]